MQYYLDTCIWRDYYEERFGLNGKPLGSYASKLFMHIMQNNDIILFSDLIIRELKKDYTDMEIEIMLNTLFLSGILKRIEIDDEYYTISSRIASERNLPIGDVIHALIAKNNNAILITQDNHFKKLNDLSEIKKPEEII